MALSTSQLRWAWYPACRNRHDFLPAYRALDACLRRWSYRPSTGTGAANCRRITGGTGYSLHSYFGTAAFTFWNGYRIPLMALAVDINPSRNPYSTRLITDMPRPMIDAIMRLRTNSGHQVWGWGGYYARVKDAMHFEIVCTPAQLRTGINPRTVPGSVTVTPTPSQGDLMIRIGWLTGEPTAVGDQADVAAAHLIISAKDKGGKSFDIEARWLSPTKYAQWKQQGVDEDLTRRAVGTFKALGIPIHGGPFNQDGLT